MMITLKNPNRLRDIRVNMKKLSGATVDLLKSTGAVTDDASGLNFCLAAYQDSELANASQTTGTIKLSGDWLLELDGQLNPSPFTLSELELHLQQYNIQMTNAVIPESEFIEVNFSSLTAARNRIRLIKTSTSKIQDTVDSTISIKDSYLDFYVGGIPEVTEPDIRLILSDGSEETYTTGPHATLELMYPEVDFENTESATYIDWALYAESVEEMHVAKSVTSIDSTFSPFVNLRHLNLNGGGVVGDEAFPGLNNLDSVYIGPYVTSLGNQALAGSQYNTLQIDEGIAYIGEAALAGNQRCNELIIPNSVTSLGAQVAAGWGQPRKLVIGSGLKDIRGDEFQGWGNAGATELVLKEGLERIGTVSEYAFQGWHGVELTLPDTVNYVGKSAFFGWNSAQKLTIGTNPVVLDNTAFALWQGDVVLDLGGTTTIGDGTFQGWENTTTPITIPSTVKTIAGSAFLNWFKCEGLTFEEGVTDIGYIDESNESSGEQSFTNWYMAKYLHLPDSLVSTRGSFVNWYLCNDLHIGSELTTLGGLEWLENEFTNMGRDTPDFDLVIPDTVTSIINAFGGSNPRSIVLGSGVTEIGNFAYQTDKFYIRTLTPPTILESNMLPSSRPEITVYVPSITTYVADEQWANLYNVQTSETRMTLFEEWVPA